MKTYYILVDGKRSGPFNTFELKEKKIQRDTKVWDSDEQYWFNAEEFPELRHIIIVKGHGDEYISDPYQAEGESSDSGGVNFPAPVMAGEGYYILINQKSVGPFSIYELKERKIYTDTKVWDEDSKSWINAEDFPALRRILLKKDERDKNESKINNSEHEDLPKSEANTDEKQKEYYVLIDGQKSGPYKFDDLKEKNIFTYDEIWSDRFNGWIRAEKIPELRPILIQGRDTGEEENSEQENIESPTTVSQDENQKGYYVLIDGKKTGPFTIYQLKEKNIFTHDEVWSDEHTDWIRADEFPELRPILIQGRDTGEEENSEQENTENPTTVSPDENPKGYYVLIDGKKTGPFTIYQLKEKNIFIHDEVWSDEHTDWIRADEFPELRHILIEGEDTGEGPYFGYHIASVGARLIGYLASIVCQLFVYGVFMLIGYLFAKSTLSTAGIIFYLICIYGGLITSYIIVYLRYPKYCGNYGHKLMGLKVISSETGEDYNKLGQGILREVLKLIFGYLFIPVIWLLWDDNNQNLYDKITNTYVVKKRD
ncbi:MAG: RDD family protein [Bacteroidetes bacterium]|nr:RDD family protein [Bacteroidota bacterium]